MCTVCFVVVVQLTADTYILQERHPDENDVKLAIEAYKALVVGVV